MEKEAFAEISLASIWGVIVEKVPFFPRDYGSYYFQRILHLHSRQSLTVKKMK